MPVLQNAHARFEIARCAICAIRVDQVNAPARAFRQADSLHRIGKERIARARLHYQQVLQWNTLDKTAWVTGINSKGPQAFAGPVAE